MMNKHPLIYWILCCLFLMAACKKQIQETTQPPSSGQNNKTLDSPKNTKDYPAIKIEQPAEPNRKESTGFDRTAVNQRIEAIRNLRFKDQIRSSGSFHSLTRKNPLPPNEWYQWIRSANPNSYLCINFENDIFTDCDWYYTNGIRIDFTGPSLGHSPLMATMLPSPKEAVNYYTLSFVHKMFTPKDPHIDAITNDDRPFSAYFYVGHVKVANVPARHYRQTSEFRVGLIGSATKGQTIQETIHFAEINGWANQVSNDLILDYHLRLEKGFNVSRFVEIGWLLDANGGTLYNRAGAGGYLMAGLFDTEIIQLISPYTWGPANPVNKSFQCFLNYSFLTNAIGYDATLQGGVFTESAYALPASHIERITFTHSLGLVILLRGFSVCAEYVLQSPEYKGCVPHSWVRCNINFCL
jgi:hypothetical protein